MDKRGFHAESAVERIDRVTAAGKRERFSPLVFITRLIVIILATVSAWFAFATPLIWWAVVGTIWGSFGLVSLRSYLKRGG